MLILLIALSLELLLPGIKLLFYPIFKIFLSNNSYSIIIILYYREKTAVTQKLRNLEKSLRKIDINLNQTVTKFISASQAENESLNQTFQIAKSLTIEKKENEKLER